MNDRIFKLLLVDDDKSLLNNLVRFFEDEGFLVLVAHNGEEALELLAKEQVDGAIVDMRLPSIDGNEVILQGSRLQPKIKFLIHTGSTDYFLPAALRNLGITEDQVYLKPVMELGILSDHMLQLVKELNDEE